MNLAFLKQKKWGLPIWAWAAITAVVLGGLYYYYKKKSASSSSDSSTSPNTSSTDSSNLPLSTLPYGYGDGSSGFGGSGDYNGYSPPVTPTQNPLVIELQQNPNTNPISTQTTPPPDTSNVGTLAGSNALLSTIFTSQTAPFAPLAGPGSKSATPGGASANQTQGVFATDSSGGLVNAPTYKAPQPPIKTTNAVKNSPSPVPVGTSGYSAKSKNTSLH